MLHFVKKIRFNLLSSGFLHQNADTSKNRLFLLIFVGIQSRSCL